MTTPRGTNKEVEAPKWTTARVHQGYSGGRKLANPLALITTVVPIKGFEAYNVPQWREEMIQHVADLKKLGVFEACRLPPGKTAIKARWVFATKGSAPNIKYKVRWVGKGFMQVPGRDYICTWSPTIRLESLHILMALAARHGLQVWQFDVKDAYLTADLEIILYVQAPPEIFVKGIVWKLKKALPGLKQSGRAW